jgi:hypothetical protein
MTRTEMYNNYSKTSIWMYHLPGSVVQFLSSHISSLRTVSVV